MTSKHWSTLFTRNHGCRLPVMGAPMAGVSGGSLAFETSRAGGLGFIAAGHFHNEKSFERLRKEIKIFQDLMASSASSFPLCIGFIGHSTFGSDSSGWDLVLQLLEEYKPEVVQIFAPAIAKVPSGFRESTHAYRNNVEMCQSFGCQVIAQVGSVKEGIEALEAGVDCLIAQGTEAGGHGIRRELGNGTLSLTAQLVHISSTRERRVPVLAAGGIVDGRGLLAALSLGADGAILGTRLWASKEALGSSSYKNALVAAKSCDDVVRTRVFDTINNSQRATKWPHPFDSSGTLRNTMTDKWDTSIHALEAELNLADGTNKPSTLVEEFNRAEENSLPDRGCVYSGQGVGSIVSILPTYDIIVEIEKEALEELTRLHEMTPL